MRILVLVNPNSHVIRKAQGVLKFTERKLKDLKVDFEIDVPSQFKEFSERAREAKERGFDIVAVAGGDGTLREVASGLIENKLPMGVIPLGISNVFAQSLNIPTKIGEALETLKSGVPKSIDVGLANGNTFLLMLGAGLDAMAVFETKQWMKDIMGKGAYLLAGAKAYPSFRSKPIRVFLDDGKERIAGYEVVISNVPLYGGKFVMCPNARWDDGFLDVCIFRGLGFFNYSRYVWGVVRGKHTAYPDVIMRQAKKVRLVGSNVPCHIDSDPFGTLPVEVAILRSSLKVIVPHDRSIRREKGSLSPSSQEK